MNLKNIQHSYSWLFVFGLFIGAECLVNPIGEFPLNDDWAYARTVYDYCNSQIYRPSFWQSIYGYTPFIIAVSACKIFGFSFTLLRCINLFSVLISVFYLDKILKFYAVSSERRLMANLLLAFNPVCFNLSNTFLSDVIQLPFTLAAVLYLLYILNHENRRGLNFSLFILFSLLASLNRQNGIAIPILFICLYLDLKKLNLKNVLLSVWPLLLTLVSFYLLHTFLKGHAQNTPNANLQWHQFKNSLINVAQFPLKPLAYYFVTSSIALGLFILPLSLFHFVSAFQKIKSSKWWILGLLIYLSLIIYKVFVGHKYLPYVGNLFYHLGIGPIIISGFDTNHDLSLSEPVKLIYTIFNLVGGLSFFISIIVIFKSSIKLNPVSKLFGGLILVYLVPLCLSYVNDRYLLYVWPFYLMAFILSSNQPVRWLYFLMLVIPMIYFSVAGTHDYLAIHRAKNKAAKYLLNQKISAAQIDGGFEFNAWYFAGSKQYNPLHQGNWWWVQDNEYIITPRQYQGYELLKEVEFEPWIFWHFKKINILKRIENKITSNNQ